MNPSRKAATPDLMPRISPAQFGWGLVTLLALVVLVFHRDLLRANREPEVVLSEILAVNHSALDDADGEFPGWIELHNRGHRPVNLGGWHLTDDFRDPTRWTFPPVTLEPGAFLVIFASGKDRTNRVDDLHTNFRLDPKGRFLGLARPGGSLFEDEFQPKYPALPGDVSFGMLPAGEASAFRLRRHALFVTPTPGETNRGEMLGQVADTRFSHTRGFHGQPFELTIGCRTPDSEIRYTLDGSLPRHDHGEVYSHPIPVTNTTIVRAAAFRPGFRPSNVDTLTFLFPDRPGESTRTSTPIEDGRASSDKPPLTAALTSLPIVSLVLDPADLWDPARGLQANPSETGSDWERAASMEWIESGLSGSRARDKAAFCGVRIHKTRDPLPTPEGKHSFRLVFREIHGTPEWSGALLGPMGPNRFRTLLLQAGSANRDAGGDGPAGSLENLLQGALVRETYRAMGRPSPTGRFVQLLLNGRYWGVYDLCERTDTRMLANRSGEKPSTFEIRTDDQESSAQEPSWTRIAESCRLGLSDSGRYLEMEALVDLEAFADAIILQFHAGVPEDRIGKGWIAARRKVPAESTWTFLPALAGTDGGGSKESQPDAKPLPVLLFQSLRVQPEFRRLLEERLRKHLDSGGALSIESMRARYESLLESLRPAVVAEANRWGKQDSPGSPKPVKAPLDKSSEDPWEAGIQRLRGL